MGRAEVFDLSSKVLSLCLLFLVSTSTDPLRAGLCRFHQMTIHKEDKWEIVRGKTGESVWVCAFSLRYVAPSLQTSKLLWNAATLIALLASRCVSTYPEVYFTMPNSMTRLPIKSETFDLWCILLVGKSKNCTPLPAVTKACISALLPAIYHTSQQLHWSKSLQRIGHELRQINWHSVFLYRKHFKTLFKSH